MRTSQSRCAAASLRTGVGRKLFPALLFGTALAAGCDKIQALIGGGTEKVVAEAEGKLKQGDLPGAAGAYEQAAIKHATDVDIASGAAFSMMLQGEHKRADEYLAAAEATAGERTAEIKMRRALIALEAGELDSVRAHGVASGLPAGKLLGAEVALADGEREEASKLLKEASAAGGQVGQTAKAYLELMESEDVFVQGLAEVQALWALGARKLAVSSVEDMVKNLPEDAGNRETQLLIWAGRAASVRETEVARSLVDAIIFPPEGQAWRKVATLAIISCAEGDGAGCLSQLESLEGNAPADGLADARATAAFLIAEEDAEVARKLAGPYVSNAAARALVEADDMKAAAESVPGGVLGDFVKSGG